MKTDNLHRIYVNWVLKNVLLGTSCSHFLSTLHEKTHPILFQVLKYSTHQNNCNGDISNVVDNIYIGLLLKEVI